jgi:hypothetical protein
LQPLGNATFEAFDDRVDLRQRKPKELHPVAIAELQRVRHSNHEIQREVAIDSSLLEHSIPRCRDTDKLGYVFTPKTPDVTSAKRRKTDVARIQSSSPISKESTELNAARLRGGYIRIEHEAFPASNLGRKLLRRRVQHSLDGATYQKFHGNVVCGSEPFEGFVLFL